MKLFTFCLLLPVAMVATAPIRAQRENVLSFLHDSLRPSTEKIPGNVTANPPNESVKDDDSEDSSRSLDSDAMMISQVLEKDKAPSTRRTNGGTQVGEQEGSGERSGPHGPQPASRERTDRSSEETLEAQERDHLPGKHGFGSNGMFAPGSSRELMDRDSLEDNGRPAPVGNRGDTDYDETRELISAETHPEHMASSFPAPAKVRAS
ncbi:uncharacterized protein LOC120810608 isoform X1 [Gasterosteus aculeatus]